MMFKELEGDTAVVVIGGVYKQVDLYTRNGFLFCKAFGGFIRLYANGSTSKDKCRIDALSTEKDLFADRLGRLCDASVSGAEALDAGKMLALTDGR